jgi:bifunctional non-homologous end joining protein LigD
MQPQLATLVSTVPREGDWVYEIKFDGYRILARISGSSVALYSRTGKDWTRRMPDIAHALGQLETKSAWLDGEVVALDAQGRSDFQRLQNSFEAKQNAALTFCMFDLPYADGRDLRDEPLLARKARLEGLLAGVKSPNLAFSSHTAGDGPALLAAACKRGLEGLIAKLATSTYSSARSRTWLKLKCKQRQEFVVGGYTDPGGSRTGFGALLLGVQERGALRYVGKVGTGFDGARLDSLRQKFESLRRTTTPFVNPPRGSGPSGAHWLEPSLVAEVSFAQWTEDGVLRQAVFHGLREDKAASDVKPERIAKAPAPHSRQGANAESVHITHPDRVIFPAAALTKGALAAYYAEAAERILPHLRDRPLSLLRCPDGVGKACFYQKHALAGVADVLIVEIEEKDGEAPYMIANSANALLSLVQMSTIELHTWGATRQQLERPDRIIFDLDPDPTLEWRYVVEAAGLVRTVLDELGLRAFVKTTGGKGLHVVVPITRRHTWEAAKEFSRAVAEHIAATVPQHFTANMSKARRKGRIFIDFHRNERGATAVAAYSVRANPGATVSVPLAWEELDVKLQSTHFTLQNISRRLASQPDPWHEYWNIKQSLTPAMTRKLAGAARS